MEGKMRKTSESNCRLLPDGNIFGSKKEDEFHLSYDESNQGVFKRFEYLSLPFSITGNDIVFQELLSKAEKSGTSFQEELEKNPQAKKIVSLVLQQMETSPAFSRQTLDHLLSEVYLNDNAIVGVNNHQNSSGGGDELDLSLARIIFSWKKLADFYCIEGLVGGDGKNNPFNNTEEASFVAGGLDSLERILPVLKDSLDSKTWKKVCLQLSSVVGRTYKQVDSAVDVLGSIYDTKGLFSEADLYSSLDLINNLKQTTLETNREVGRFYNSLIRFANWLPLALRRDGLEGSAYDSICEPAKRSLEILQDDEEIIHSLVGIVDATSPKGLALVALADDGKLSDKTRIKEELQELEKKMDFLLDQERKKMVPITLEDPVFYSGLVGGKWKGIKLLHDAKEAFNLNYKIPAGGVIPAFEVTSWLEENGITEILNEDIFSLSEERREEITRRIDSGLKGLSNYFLFQMLGRNSLPPLEGSFVVRSSMYGEDGVSNFSGTYESFFCEAEGLSGAVENVIKSYFHPEAIRSREDVGLAHVPGISLIIQEKIAGKGGVIYLTEGEYSLSLAVNPEEAVLGNGNHKSAESIRDLVCGTPLQKLEGDLEKLHGVFGDSDIEYVVDENADVYLTQLRPKYKVSQKLDREIEADRLIVSSLNHLPELHLDEESIVQMSFLGRENINDKEDVIMDFIRNNRRYILAVEGSMPPVAHIPNKIEGHFRIPYLHLMEGG